LKPSGRAARAGPALVAGCDAGVAKIPAAGALQEIAADRRHVAHLRRGAGQQCLGDNRITPAQIGIVGEIAHLDERANAGSIIANRELVERQSVQIDEPLRPLDLVLHQLQ